MLRRPPLWTRARWAAPLALAVCMGAAGPALAFDTGPHFDITEDVLRAEGFGSNAIRTAQAANFLIDFHEFMRKDMFKKALDPKCRAQLEQEMKIADELQHFDDLDDVTQVAHRWDSMIAGTQITAGVLMGVRDSLGLLVLLGASLHNVQDFYAHSNWVEYIGKGTLAPYGSHPTWLRVDRPVREKLDVFTRREKGTSQRTHGDWNSPATALNQDWTGRPNHLDAYRCAWFATREWVRLFRTFVDASMWARMQQLTDRRFDASWDWEHARKISFYGGHWNGNGSPSGPKDVLSELPPGTSLDLLIPAVLDYLGYGFTSVAGLERPCLTNKRSEVRAKIESLLRSWGTAPYTKAMDPPLPSASPDSVTFVRMQIEDIVAIDPDDGRSGGEMDWYGRARIGGQRYWTCLIDEHNDFHFKPPNAPWTMMKAIQPADDPVRSLVVRVQTGVSDDTDDNVYLWLSDKLKLEFPYDPDENDFTKGATYDYSFAVPSGLRLADITRLRIEKSSGDNWQLASITVFINDRIVYQKNGVNAWLTDQRPVWDATDFRIASAGNIPLHFDLMELDYKTDDRADINMKPNAKSLFFEYSPTTGRIQGDIATNPAITQGFEGPDKARIRLAVDALPASCHAASATSARVTGP